MRLLSRLGWGLAGLVGGLGIALAIAACCPETKDIVWEVLPGTYRVDPRLLKIPDPLHGDTDYEVVVSADGTRAVETYQRAGKTYRTVYALGPGQDSPMRSDLNLYNER